MTVPPLLAIGLLMNLVAVLFVLVCIVLVLVVLIQKGRGGGLSGAFGGGMASGLLGSKTGDFLTWVTIIVVGVFLALAVLLAKFYRPKVGAEYDVEAPTTTQQSSAPATQPPVGGTAQPAAPALPAGQSGAAAPAPTAAPAPAAEQPGAATTPAPAAPASAPAAEANATGG